MEQVVIRDLNTHTLVAYREVAKAKGSSLEDELRAVLEAHRPATVKDCAALLRLSDEALAMTLPDGPPIGSNSTLLIRWDRDTDHGRWMDDGWTDDAGR